MDFSISQVVTEITTFAKCVYESSDIIEIRRVPSGESSWHTAETLANRAESLMSDNSRNQHIYVGGCPRKAIGGTSREDVKLARCLWCDWDGGDPENHVRAKISAAGLPDPTLLLFSGGGIHGWWRLADPIMDLTTWTLFQKRLIAMVGSDKSIHDPPRIMRLPGFFNCKAKYNPLPLCRILEADPARVWTLEEMRLSSAQLATRPAAARVIAPPTQSHDDQFNAAVAFIETQPQEREGGRNPAAYRIAAKLAHHFRLSPTIVGMILAKWNEKNEPPLEDDELYRVAKNARKYGDKPPSDNSGNLLTQAVAGLVLIPRKVRRTPSKITVQVEVQKDTQAVDLVTASSSAAGRKAALKAILAHTEADGAAKEIDAALGRILVEATASKADVNSTKCVHEILAEFISTQIDFSHREDAKAYSPMLNQLISRSQFIERFTSESVLGAVGMAGDVPRDPETDEVVRPQLITLVERELKILWGEIISKLPIVADAEIAADSVTAQKFRQSVVLIWSRPKNMGVLKQEIGDKCQNAKRDSVQVMAVESLASRLRKMLAEGLISADKWCAVRDGYDAYCRLQVGPAKGEEAVRLAMRYTLADQIGVKIPGVENETALTKLANKFSLAETNPPFGDRLTGGSRLIVLSLSLSDDIRAVPTNEENPLSDSETASLPSLDPKDDAEILPSDTETLSLPSLAEA